MKKKTLRASKEINKLIEKNNSIKLDLGCGKHKTNGYVGMDMFPFEGVDIVHNVEDFPFPLPDECVSVAIASNLVEHINPHNCVFIRFMNEMWRIMKPGGEFLISAPYAFSPGDGQDPSHCNHITEVTWDYFDPLGVLSGGGLYHYYGTLPWEVKINTWDNNGYIETVMRKRIIDKSYDVNPTFLEELAKHKTI